MCDIVSVLKVPQPKVSRHLAALKKCGLVNARKEGLWIHYSLRLPAHSMHKKLLDTLGLCGALEADLVSDAMKLSRIRKSLGCCG